MSTYNRRQLNKQHVNPEIQQIIRNSEPANMQAKRHYQRAHANREKRSCFWCCFCLHFCGAIISESSEVARCKCNTDSDTSATNNCPKTNSDLKADQKRLNDPAYLQQILRDKYGYTKSGELVYNLPSNNN